MKVHPIVAIFALIGSFVLAMNTVEIASSDNCCSGSKWQAESAKDKLDTLWGKIVANTKPATWPNVATLAGALLIENMDVTFDRVADDFPFDRTKFIHTVGNHAKARWVAKKNPYTGIFQGSDYAIIRLSPAGQPDVSIGTDPSKCDPQCGFIPGMSMKFLRDGYSSGNIVNMYSLIGQPSFNFFRNNFTNHPPLACEDITGSFKHLYDKFGTASQWPTMVGVSEMALYDQYGNQTHPNYPYQLWLVPNPKLTASFPDQPASDWTDKTLANQLASIPVGTTLWTVYAWATPTVTSPLEIAEIVIDTQFTTSNWGDKNMFMEHTRMEDDALLHEDWKPYFPECPGY